MMGARAAVAAAGGLGAVWVLRLILGPWAAALVVAPVLVAVVVAGWALLDRALFAPPPPEPRRLGPVIDVPVRPVRHRRADAQEAPAITARASVTSQ